MDILNVNSGPDFDETIWEKQYHTHNPYASSKLGNNDEIRIPIQQQDAYTLPCESYLYIEGRATKKDGTTASGVPFISNAMAYLFEEIRYEISGITVDSTKRVGITSTIKGLLSYSPRDINWLHTAGWRNDLDNVTLTEGYFDFCVPLKTLLGFAEDYSRIVMNVKQELFLLRAATDNDLILAPAGTTVDNLEFKLQLDKIVWRVPHVRIADDRRLKLLKQLDADRPIIMPFRSWETHEYPVLPSNSRQSWAIKTSTHLERPRYVILALQTNRKNNILRKSCLFDHCSIQNVKLYLNENFYPYDNLMLSFDKNRYSILYDMFSKFQSSYYNRTDSPLISPDNFFTKTPIVVIDCSKQNESVKSSSVDIRLEFETDVNIPGDTTAYCVILHDTIVSYTPLTGTVRRIM